MEKNKSPKNEGIFSMADKFVADFFDRLKQGAADQIIKKAENANLPPKAIEHMKKMEKDAKEFKQFLKSL
jgi:hypothetical protein